MFDVRFLMLSKRRVVQLFSMPKPECYMYVMFVSKCSFHVKEKKVVVRKKKNKKRVIVWLYVFVYKHVEKMFVATKK